MNKTAINEFIHNMTKGGAVTKVTPWTVEGFGDKALDVRYMGLKQADDWLDIWAPGNNLLMKFLLDKQQAKLEWYLANTPPFIQITTTQLASTDKWEHVLGEFKRRLKKDKEDVLRHRESVGNLYTRIKPYIK